MNTTEGIMNYCSTTFRLGHLSFSELNSVKFTESIEFVEDYFLFSKLLKLDSREFIEFVED